MARYDDILELEPDLTRLPIVNALLNTDDDDQALARMHVKGAEAARTAIEMANLLKRLDEQG